MKRRLARCLCSTTHRSVADCRERLALDRWLRSEQDEREQDAERGDAADNGERGFETLGQGTQLCPAPTARASSRLGISDATTFAE
jgi:hypothetical protein